MPVLDFLSAGAAQSLVREAARAAGIEVAGSFGAVGAMLERYRAGEASDVVILTHAQVAELTAKREVLPRSAADLGSVATSVAVRAGDPVPDVATEEGLRGALLAADAIYFPDPAKSTAGIHFAKVLQRLAIAAQVAARVRTFPNGATAMRELAQAPGHPIGCTQSTEILATAGARLVAPLPKGYDLETVYTAAVNARARDAGGAAQFVARITGDASWPARGRAGFHGVAIRPAVAGDAAAVRDIVRAALIEHGLPPDPSGIDAELDDLEASYFAPGGAFDVAVASDGRIVGCCGVYPLDDVACDLRKMYLAPHARGRGIGARLLERARAFAASRGCRRLELETAAVLERAIALYTRAGFRPVARTPHVGRCDQVYALDL
jgi:molybdate transport system substrate-binding protein